MRFYFGVEILLCVVVINCVKKNVYKANKFYGLKQQFANWFWPLAEANSPARELLFLSFFWCFFSFLLLGLQLLFFLLSFLLFFLSFAPSVHLTWADHLAVAITSCLSSAPSSSSVLRSRSSQAKADRAEATEELQWPPFFSGKLFKFFRWL